MFGSQAAKPGGSFSFGAPATTQPSLTIPTFSFGNPPTSQPQQTNTGFGSTTTQAQPSGGLFGTSSQPQQQQSTSLFGNSNQTQQGGGIFGSLGQSSQTGAAGGLSQANSGSNPFGQSQQQQQQQQPQRPLDQTLRFGQSQQGATQPQNGAQPLWEEGRGLGVYRSIPAQMGIIKEKWDPASLMTPLRTYLYQHVGDEGEALRYRPGPGEDENKWEEAVSRRPGPAWVPLLVRGFFELGKKAQIQMEAIQRCNMMLQEINTSLDIQLDTHRQKVSTRLAECKRRHQAASQRTLALAVKVQILRNRGYVMDNAEEELKSKLEKLGREILDPSLNAREQEIWARMLGIRERAKRLKSEMDKITPASQNDEPLLDEDTVKAAKQVCCQLDISTTDH